MGELIYYERNLPHRLPPGEAIFITFRLAGTIPREVLAQLQAEAKLVESNLAPEVGQLYTAQKRYFGRFDKLLAQAEYGPVWLRQPDVAAIVAQSLHHFDSKAYTLPCYCLMPNHIHLVVTLPDEAPPLARTLQRIKGYTALQANKLLGRTGAFWQAESYDHVVRQGELERIIAYVVENPVKAGLVDDWQRWPFTYVARTL